MSLYVFDFDGVLFDTARECLAIAYAAVRKLPDASFERWRRRETPPDDVAAQFLSNRHWVGPPWQYAVLLECIATARLPSSTAGFLTIANARKAELESFTELYFATRGELSQDVERWCSVIQPYRPSVTAFRRLHSVGRAAILSTRDDSSIRRIVGHFLGVNDLMLLPRSGEFEKWEILLETASNCELSPRSIFFLDDYVQHALPALQHGIAAHLALWGYLGGEDVYNARAGGLPCVELIDLDRALARHEEELDS